MGALGTVYPNGDLDLALTIRTFAVADGPDPPLGRRRHRLGLGAAGGDRGVLGQGAAAARRDRRARARAGGARDAARARRVRAAASSTRTSPSSTRTTWRCSRGRAAFETLRVYAGRPFRLDEHLDAPRRLGRADRPPRGRRRPSSSALARTALDGGRDARLRRCASTGRAAARARDRPTALALVSPLPAELRGAARAGRPR